MFIYAQMRPSFHLSLINHSAQITISVLISYHNKKSFFSNSIIYILNAFVIPTY